MDGLDESLGGVRYLCGSEIKKLSETPITVHTIAENGHVWQKCPSFHALHIIWQCYAQL